MKVLKIIALIVVSLLLYSAYVVISPDNDNSKTGTIPALGGGEEYKKNQDDRDTNVESNKALVLSLAKVQDTLDKINKKQAEQATDITNLKDKPNKTEFRNKEGQDLVSLVKEIVNKNIPKADPKDLKFKINNSNPLQQSGAKHNTDVNKYSWSKTLRSGTTNEDGDFVSATAKVSASNVFSQNNEEPIETNANGGSDPIPAYTIPSNAALTGVLVTGMLGRIPVDNQVSDPYRFSVKITDRSFFANHHESNDLQGVIASGTAQGDLLLSCVKANIDSLTFIFEDGTISDHKISDAAFIANEYGYPCIDGELITNAPTYLSASALFSGLSGTAEAFAQAEQTISSDASGNSSSRVTGDSVKFAGYNAASSGISDIQRWVNERAQSSFDVVFVPSGKKIKLITQSQINIDYDPQGRKLNHALDSKQGASYELD